MNKFLEYRKCTNEINTSVRLEKPNILSDLEVNETVYITLRCLLYGLCVTFTLTHCTC